MAQLQGMKFAVPGKPDPNDALAQAMFGTNPSSPFLAPPTPAPQIPDLLKPSTSQPAMPGQIAVNFDQWKADPQSWIKSGYAPPPPQVTRQSIAPTQMLPDAGIAQPPEAPAPQPGNGVATPPSQADYIAQNGHAPIPNRPFAPQGWKQNLLAGLAATADNFGAALNHTQPTVGRRIMEQAQEALQYDANRAPMQTAADEALYGKHLGQEQQRSNIANAGQSVMLPDGRIVYGALAKAAVAPTINANTRTGVANQANDTRLLGMGMRKNAAGELEQIPQSELPPTVASKLALNDQLDRLRAAQEDVAKSKTDPNSPMFKLAMAKLGLEQQRTQVMLGNLGLHKDTFERDTYGTVGGNPIPGLTDANTGQPIGLKVKTAAEPTADRVRKGDLAVNVQQNIDSAQSIIKNRPDLFGALAGRYTTVQQMIGSNDPDIAKMGVIIHNTALASNGVHGVRGAGAVEATENELLNHFRNGQEATTAALSELRNSMGTFVDAQKLGKQGNFGGKLPQATAPQGGAREVTAVGPNGHTIAFRNGAWVDAQTGKAIQ